MEYDAQQAPDAEEWLALEDEERNDAVVDYHEEIGEKLPSLKIHAIVHVIVENEIAMGEEAPVQALERLVSERLDRHEAIHAIGSVLAEKMFSAMGGDKSEAESTEEYNRELAKLTAKKWRGMTG